MSEFIESIQMWINNLSVNSIIIFIMMIFMLIGAVDRIQGNRWGYGQQLWKYSNTSNQSKADY